MKARSLLKCVSLPLAFLCFLSSCGKKAASNPGPPPPTAVIVVPVVQRTVPIYVENVAQTEAAETVEIRARVQGFLQEAPFQEGGRVKKGDLLFQIDPKPFQAAVEQARANLAKAEATRDRAKDDVKRLEPLVKQNAISQQDLDNAVSTARVAEAEVMAEKAAVTTAELSLGYSTMRAPFDGMVGSRLVDVGNFVGNSTDTILLAVVSTTEPMRVHFNVSEGNFLRFQRRFLGNEAAKEKHSAEIEFSLLLGDGSVYEHRGKFEFADRALDAKAGTLKVVVSFPNPEGLLRPGQFGRVRAMTEERPNALLVPQRAVVTNQNLKSVLVVGEGNKVEQRAIKTADRFEDSFIVVEGLKAGERVVLEGLQKARPGTVVNPMDPEPVPAPSPPEVMKTPADRGAEPAAKEPAPAGAQPAAK